MIKIKVAGHVFGLENKYDFVRFMCRDYLCDDEPEVVFESSVRDADARREFSILYHEYLHLRFPICNHLIQHDTLMFHASCIEYGGKAYLFSAPKETGKSTHTRLWRERFGKDVTMINDDKPFLHFGDDIVTAYGSPWNGHHYLDTNTSAPVEAVVILRQAPECSIRRLSTTEALPLLLSNHFPPSDFEMRIKAMQLIGKLAQLPVYELSCTPTQDAVTLAHATITNFISHKEPLAHRAEAR